MTDRSVYNERTRGIFTEKDGAWLQDADEAEFNPSDQKRRLQKGLVLALNDVRTLVDDDFEASNLDNIGELFDRVEEAEGLSRTESAKYLIALAFRITNDSIDYGEIAEEMVVHPRKSEESPTDDNRAEAGSPVNFNQPVDRILAFREALSEGIKLGKQHYDSETDIPNTILIDANTRLYKEPTEAGLKSPSITENSENWFDVVADNIDSDGPAEYVSSPEEIDPSEAPKYLKHEIEYNIEYLLSRRRVRSDQEVLQRKLDF